MKKLKFPLPSCSTLIVAGVVLLALILLSSSYTQVEYGTVGLVTRYSKVTWGIMPPGSFVPFLNLTPGETVPGTTIVPSTVVTKTTQ